MVPWLKTDRVLILLGSAGRLPHAGAREKYRREASMILPLPRRRSIDEREAASPQAGIGYGRGRN
jgi:hypothetical protein